MKKPRLTGGLAVLALSASFSACGSTGGSSAGTTTGSALSRSKLAAQAGAICASSTTKGRAVTPPADLASNANAAAAYFDKIVPLADQETKDFQALTPAADVAGDWRAFLAAQVALDQQARMLKQKADAGNPVGLAGLRKLLPAGQRVVDAASKLGATCTSG